MLAGTDSGCGHPGDWQRAGLAIGRRFHVHPGLVDELWCFDLMDDGRSHDLERHVVVFASCSDPGTSMTWSALRDLSPVKAMPA